MIVVFGSLIADMVFAVDALPRPGETVLSRDAAVHPGGKGANQAVAAARAGASVRMAGCVGRDPFGDLLVSSLDEAGVDASLVVRGELPSGRAAVCVDRQGENQIAIAPGANGHARADQVADDRLPGAGLLMLQLEVTPEENWSLAARARAAGTRVLLNAAPAVPFPTAILDGLDILVVNEGESAVIADRHDLGNAKPEAFARHMAERHGLDCVVTLGAEGAVAAIGEDLWRIGALAIEAVDSTAAGDAFVGAYAAALDGGLPAPEALRRASVAGGLACLAIGAQPSLPTAAEIRHKLESLPPNQKIL